jgi:glutaconate CoA-transferase, subunit B
VDAGKRIPDRIAGAEGVTVMSAGGTQTEDYSPDEMMIVAASRELRRGSACLVGVGQPSRAANLARITHAPDIVLVYESGTIGAKPARLPLSIGDGELAETADAVVSVPEIFNYWLQPGRIDVAFLGAAQIDRYGNINSTVIGPYDRPAVRLPGAGGAPEIAASAREVIVIVKHSLRTFVERLDFVTTVGRGAGRVDGRGTGAAGSGAIVVITDLGILRVNADTSELTLTDLHPAISLDQVRAATGWALAVAGFLAETPPPSTRELEALRSLTVAQRTAGMATRYPQQPDE